MHFFYFKLSTLTSLLICHNFAASFVLKVVAKNFVESFELRVLICLLHPFFHLSLPKTSLNDHFVETS